MFFLKDSAALLKIMHTNLVSDKWVSLKFYHQQKVAKLLFGALALSQNV